MMPVAAATLRTRLLAYSAMYMLPALSTACLKTAFISRASRRAAIPGVARRPVARHRRDDSWRQRHQRSQAYAGQADVEIARAVDHLQRYPPLSGICWCEGDRDSADRAGGIACSHRATGDRLDGILLLAALGLRNGDAA